MRTKGVRSAFTLLELIVSIAILSLLMALILPAIAASREASRSVRCHNSLHQFGIAAANSASQFGAYFVQREIGKSAVECTLSFLEGGQPDQIICLSDSLADGLPGAMTYRVNAGLPHLRESHSAAFEGILEPAHRRPSYVNGTLVGEWERSTEPSDLTDGTSVTALMSERLVAWVAIPGRDTSDRDARSDFVSDRRRSYIYIAQGAVSLDEAMFEECRTTSSSYSGPFAGMPDGVGAFYPDTHSSEHPKYDHSMPPNRVSCLKGPKPPNGFTSGRSTFLSATSGHPGAVNVLYADGHVGKTSEHIDLAVWHAMGTRAGGEVVEW